MVKLEFQVKENLNKVLVECERKIRAFAIASVRKTALFADREFIKLLAEKYPPKKWCYPHYMRRIGIFKRKTKDAYSIFLVYGFFIDKVLELLGFRKWADEKTIIIKKTAFKLISTRKGNRKIQIFFAYPGQQLYSYSLHFVKPKVIFISADLLLRDLKLALRGV